MSHVSCPVNISYLHHYGCVVIYSLHVQFKFQINYKSESKHYTISNPSFFIFFLFPFTLSSLKWFLHILHYTMLYLSILGGEWANNFTLFYVTISCYMNHKCRRCTSFTKNLENQITLHHHICLKLTHTHTHTSYDKQFREVKNKT